MRRVVFLLIVLCLVGPKPAFSAKSGGKLAVKAALVAEYGTGKVLYSQDADKRIAPASVTKVMTMYLVFDALASGQAKLTDRIKVSRRADATGGSTMNLRTGETVTLDELMRGMAVASGNDATIAVAEHFGGVKHFVDMMNRKAREIGMTSTTFKNPNGLPAPGHLSTARDLMKLATSYLRRYPQALRYHCATEINHDGAVHGNTNQLLGTVEGVDGIKTGFVGASGYNIIATAKRGDTRIIAVVLGGRSKQVRNRETTRILNASFDGSVDSMVASAAASDDDAPRHLSSRHGHGRARHGKKLHVADSDRRITAKSRRGASTQLEAADTKVKRHRPKAIAKSDKPESHRSKHARSKHYNVADSAGR